jgi:hypothetical protein
VIKTRAEVPFAVGMGNQTNATAAGIGKVFVSRPMSDGLLDFLRGEERPQDTLALGKTTTHVAGQAELTGDDLGQVVTGEHGRKRHGDSTIP